MNAKKLNVVLSSVLIAGVLFSIGKRYYYSHSAPPPAGSTDIWNINRRSTLDPLPIDTSDIVFVGNSITEGFPVAEMFHSLHFKNRGISGNESKHILDRIEGIAKGRPKKIFLDVGINDIRDNVPIDILFKNYVRILSTIRTISPTTQIFAQSVFPVGARDLEAKVESFNKVLRHYCDSSGVHFVDIFPSLYKDGILNPELTYDSLHLNGKGYIAWKEKIKPYCE